MDTQENMTIREGLMKNPTEYNLDFYLRHFAATILLMYCDGLLPNVDKIMSLFSGKISRIDIRVCLIAAGLKPCADAYFDSEL